MSASATQSGRDESLELPLAVQSYFAPFIYYISFES